MTTQTIPTTVDQIRSDAAALLVDPRLHDPETIRFLIAALDWCDQFDANLNGAGR